ncbi:hypothetical protein OH799_03840 [Nocardia sp. NBC_00881]|uniref:hypothetical protein n=1 Tax=Nocardia sp. NBC_00881 TaxID=2975995 RepID=UPI00386A4585|nr:hypothetical protein OH799_03840 [Nocardia sp. NBC_00881]
MTGAHARLGLLSQLTRSAARALRSQRSTARVGSARCAGLSVCGAGQRRGTDDGLDGSSVLCEDLEDPAQVFAQSFRLTGRLHRPNRTLSKVLLADGLKLVSSDKGLPPRARRDIQAATRAGRFQARDQELAMTIAAGAVLCLGALLHNHPGRDDAEATDQVIEDLLRMFGLPPEEAHEISRLPLPFLATSPQDHSAA